MGVLAGYLEQDIWCLIDNYMTEGKMAELFQSFFNRRQINLFKLVGGVGTPYVVKLLVDLWIWQDLQN
jgi:hypothetical protein